MFMSWLIRIHPREIHTMDLQPRQLDDFGFVNTAGRRFSSVRIGKIGGEVVVVAGTHDEPMNCVHAWPAGTVCDPKHADLLLDHKGFKVDGNVSCIEMWPRSGTGSKVWVGTSTGSVKCLEIEILEGIAEEGGLSFRLTEVASVVDITSNKTLHSAATSAVAVHPVQDTFLSAGEDGHIFELQAQPSGTFSATRMKQTADWVAVYDVKYSSVGTEFFSTGASGGLQMWDARTKCCVRKFDDGSDASVPHMSIEPVETHLLAGRENGDITVFDTRFERGAVYLHASEQAEDGFHAAPVWTIRRCGGHAGLCVSCSGDGTVLASQPLLAAPFALVPVAWHRYSQAVNDVDAAVVGAGRQEELLLSVAAADHGLLVSQPHKLARTRGA